MTGKTITLDVDSDDTVGTVAEKIHEKEGIPPDQMRLIYKGSCLDFQSTLEEYKVTPKSSFALLLNMRGGMYHSSSGRNDLRSASSSSSSSSTSIPKTMSSTPASSSLPSKSKSKKERKKRKLQEVDDKDKDRGGISKELKILESSALSLYTRILRGEFKEDDDEDEKDSEDNDDVEEEYKRCQFCNVELEDNECDLICSAGHSGNVCKYCFDSMITCYICNNPFCKDCLNECSKCDELSCDQHVRKCETCGIVFCMSCHKKHKDCKVVQERKIKARASASSSTTSATQDEEEESDEGKEEDWSDVKEEYKCGICALKVDDLDELNNCPITQWQGGCIRDSPVEHCGAVCDDCFDMCATCLCCRCKDCLIECSECADLFCDEHVDECDECRNEFCGTCRVVHDNCNSTQAKEVQTQQSPSSSSSSTSSSSNIPKHGEITCQAVLTTGNKKGSNCPHGAYFSVNGKYLCGQHSSKNKKTRVALVKRTDKEKKDAKKEKIDTVMNGLVYHDRPQVPGLIEMKGRNAKVNTPVGELNVFPNYYPTYHGIGLVLPSLSPMTLGPIEHNQPGVPPCKLLENFHQCSKYFPKLETRKEFTVNRNKGFHDDQPHRHKFKRGAKPDYSIWIDQDGKEHHVGYIRWRQFYCNYYERLAANSEDLKKLREYYAAGVKLNICGPDGHGIDLEGSGSGSGIEAAYLDPSKPFGHERVLYTLIVENDPKKWPWRKHKTFDF